MTEQSSLTTAFAVATVFTGTGFETGTVVIGGDEILTFHRHAADERPDLSGVDEVIDCAGRTVMPGILDAHAHPVLGGQQLRGINLIDYHSAAEYLEVIRDGVAAMPDRAVLEGSGWFGDVFEGGLPHKSMLDEIEPTRPVILSSHDAHTLWVNSAALEAVGITGDTNDPYDGRIVRDAAGQPTGVLADGAAGLMVPLLPAASPEELDEALMSAQAHLHALGVVGWCETAVGVSPITPVDVGPVYQSAAAGGRLTARVVGALWWDRERGLEQIDDLIARRGTVGRYAATTVKIMQDGLCENHTGAMLAPYTDEPDETGASFIAPEDLKRIVQRLDAAGFQCHFHAVGDRAVRECLDAIEYARSINGPSDNRHQLAHIDILDPEDAPRFAELDVTANIQPLWARRDHEVVSRKLPLIGEVRAHHHFSFGALVQAGARIAAGSDWPVTSADPLMGAYTAITRTAPPQDIHGDELSRTTPLEPQESLTIEQALAAYTSGAAHSLHLDDVTGAIAPGMLADLIVLDRNIRTVDQLALARVERTYIGGQLVHVIDRA